MICKFEIFANILSNMLVKLIIRWKRFFASSADENLRRDEEICFRFIDLILKIVIIQLEIRFMIVIIFRRMIFHFIFIFVFLRNVGSVLALIISLISVISVFLALNFREEIWRVLIRVFVDYLQRLLWEWQGRIEWCRFFLEVSFVDEWISVALRINRSSVSTLIFEWIVLMRVELIKKLISWVSVLILI